jgi:hypothetical protein
MDIKKIVSLANLIIVLAISLLSATAMASPHFYLQMQNRSNKEATISFKQGLGNVYLEPVLGDHTALAAHESSKKYEVHIEPLDPKSTFNTIFTGKQDCTFNISYYGPANPKVIVSGAGCYGGGYQIIDNGHTLLLYVYDINKHN